MRIRLKRQKGAVFVLLLLGLAIYVGGSRLALAEDKTVMLNLTQPIVAKQTNTATAKFSELTQDAMKYGMNDATLNGNIEYSMQPDRTIRSTVKWHSISIENGSKKVTEGLDASLTSQFRVPEAKPRAEAGTKIKAKGDVEALAKSLGKLKAQLDTQQAVVQKETNNNKTQNQAVAPVVSGQQDQGNGKYLSEAGNPFNTTVEASTTTTYVECEQRFIDTANMKAVKQYKPVYTKGGVQIGEGVCAANYSEATNILRKSAACTYRFDFANSTAVKQEQLYYMEGTKEVSVGTCQDANATFALYESRTGCPVTADIANRKVFPQSKMAFMVGSLEQNATMCRAVSGSTGIPILEEACEPMWEHDYTNHVSYLVTKLYYVSDVDGSKVYVSECGRSSTVSFSHITDTSDCTPWVYNDPNLLAHQQGKTIIRTGAIAGDVVVRGCQNVATVNYSFLGAVTTNQKITTNGSFTIPPGTVSWSALIVGQGQIGNNRRDNSYGPYPSCYNGYPGKAGSAIIQDFGNATGVVSVAFNQGPGTYPDNTVLTFNGSTYIAEGGSKASHNGNEDPYWNAVAGDTGTSCSAPHAWTQGYTTTGRFGINSAADYPKSGGCGWGAGGKGAMTTDPETNMCAASPYYGTIVNAAYGGGVTLTKGAPGVVIIEYKTNTYMRPDGTTYVLGN